MAKLGPLANNDSCAEVRGLLVRLMTHFCLVLELVMLGVTVGVMTMGAVGAGAMSADVVGMLPLALGLVLE